MTTSSKQMRNMEFIMNHTTNYRIYADGTIVHEDNFSELDNATPYYDDYQEVTVPDSIINFIIDEAVQ